MGQTSGRAIGIDIGGTKCLGVVLDERDQVVATHRVPTPTGNDGLVDALVGLVGVLREEGERLPVGIGAAGLITRSGVMRASPNVFGVSELRLRDRLVEALALPIAVDNDATCATAAEWMVGAGRGRRDVLLVALGTGIGGGMVVDGHLVRGHNGFAGEIGHMIVDPSGPRCVCGQYGCWERFGSGAGLAWLARRALAEAPVAEGERLRALAAAHPHAGRAPVRSQPAAGERSSGARDESAKDDTLRGEHVVTAAREGDALARSIIAQFGWWVGLGLAGLTNTLDPSLIVIAGGLSEAADVILDPIRDGLAAHLYSPDHRPHPDVVAAVLGERAGAIGAALLARGVEQIA